MQEGLGYHRLANEAPGGHLYLRYISQNHTYIRNIYAFTAGDHNSFKNNLRQNYLSSLSPIFTERVPCRRIFYSPKNP